MKKRLKTKTLAKSPFPELESTCRAIPAPQNSLISVLFPSLRIPEVGLDWPEPLSALLQSLAISLGCRNMYEALHVSQTSPKPYFPSDLSVSLICFLNVLAYLKAN